MRELSTLLDKTSQKGLFESIARSAKGGKPKDFHYNWGLCSLQTGFQKATRPTFPDINEQI